jgi:hypothetical protein
MDELDMILEDAKCAQLMLAKKWRRCKDAVD